MGSRRSTSTRRTSIDDSQEFVSTAARPKGTPRRSKSAALPAKGTPASSVSTASRPKRAPRSPKPAVSGPKRTPERSKSTASGRKTNSQEFKVSGLWAKTNSQELDITQRAAETNSQELVIGQRAAASELSGARSREPNRDGEISGRSISLGGSRRRRHSAGLREFRGRCALRSASSQHPSLPPGMVPASYPRPGDSAYLRFFPRSERQRRRGNRDATSSSPALRR